MEGRHRIIGLGRLALSLVLGAGSLAGLQAQDPPAKALPAAKLPAPSEVVVHQWTLAECLATARERQPILHGLRASLRDAEVGQMAVEKNYPFARLVARDLDARRQQSREGVEVARAELIQAEYDTDYSVIRTYYSVVYARVQSGVAQEALSLIDSTIETVAKIVADGATKEINEITLNQLKLSRGTAVQKKIQAEEGVRKAQDGLAEAIGFICSTPIEVADTVLPIMPADLTREAIVNHALCRRGEIIMAASGVNVLEYEAQAQQALRFRLRGLTAAQGADLHARALPYAFKGVDDPYRPDVIGTALPLTLVGDRTTRVERAQLLGMRSEAVLEKARALVALEASTGYSTFVEASRQAEQLKPAVKAGADLNALLRPLDPPRATYEQKLRAEFETAQVQALYNEAVFRRLIALANLERITAGGVKAHYPGR